MEGHGFESHLRLAFFFQVTIWCKNVITGYHVVINIICILNLIHYSFQGRGERAYDIFSRLLKERIVCVMGPVSNLFSAIFWRGGCRNVTIFPWSKHWVIPQTFSGLLIFKNFVYSCRHKDKVDAQQQNNWSDENMSGISLLLYIIF